MRTKTKLSLAGLVAAVAMAAVPAGASATTGTFTSGPGVIPNNSISLVPVTVSGLPGVITDVNVTVNEMQHVSDGSDIDLLLRNPNGGSVVLLSDAGGANQPLTPSNFTFDDAAADLVPSTGALSGGTFRPTNYDGLDGDSFAPAPAGAYGATLSALNGFNANAVWELYARDDTDDSGGGFANYAVTVTTNASGTPTVGPKPKKAKKKKKCKPKKKASQKPKKCKPKKGKPHQ